MAVEAGSGLSASRTRQAYHLLKSLLDEAVKDARLLRNPATGVDLPRLRAKERRYLTHAQVATLAEACRGHRTSSRCSPTAASAGARQRPCV